MRRASVSISSNLAEGASRDSNTDFSRFVEIAAGSIYELVSQSSLSRQLGFLSEADYQHIRESACDLVRMLSGLRRSLARRPSTRSR
jgi:four helix bundle protein